MRLVQFENNWINPEHVIDMEKDHQAGVTRITLSNGTTLNFDLEKYTPELLASRLTGAGR
jgi:competence transcription factor ComK